MYQEIMFFLGKPCQNYEQPRHQGVFLWPKPGESALGTRLKYEEHISQYTEYVFM